VSNNNNEMETANKSNNNNEMKISNNNNNNNNNNKQTNNNTFISVLDTIVCMGSGMEPSASCPSSERMPYKQQTNNNGEQQ
jgi:hypothetical protein